ncbi:unnamed protein product [Ectocarpus sp. 6 AP-2014]
MSRIESEYSFGSKPFGHYKGTPRVPIENVKGFRVGRDGWKEVFHLFFKNCDHPALQDQIYFQDERFMVIYDGYPKARHHLLLMPRPSFLDVMRPSDLRREHLSALRQMHALGRAVAEHLSQQGIGEIRIGVHAVPSMEPLHMHIISQDFDSERLRMPRHWNIFTTDIFLEPAWVEEMLERHGCLQLDLESRYIRLKEQTPRCHICQETIGGVERLKAHYLSHEAIARVYGPPRQRNARQVGRRSIPEPPRHEQRHLGRADPRSQQGSWRRGHSAPQTRVRGAQYQGTRSNEFPQGKPVSYLGMRPSRSIEGRASAVWNERLVIVAMRRGQASREFRVRTSQPTKQFHRYALKRRVPYY